MKRMLWVAAVAAVGLVGLARAEAPGVTASPADIIAGRQAAFDLSAGVFGAMRPVIEAGGDVKPLTRGARNLNKWAKALPGMFPAGSGVGSTTAKSTVWTDRAGFEQAAGNFAQATGKLAELAEANDKDGFAAQYKVVGAACGDCHKLYRIPDPH